MDTAFFYKLILLPNHYFSVISLVLIGLYFIDQKNFFYITISTLFSIILTAYLKSIWQIPLNPELHKLGWSYPSTHTVFNVVFYGLIFMFYRKFWVLLLGLIVVIPSFFAMVYFRYHIWIDIWGGICVAGIILTLLYYWVKHAFHAQFKFGILLSIVAMTLLLLLPDLPHNYGWDWQVLGFIISLTICNELTDLKKIDKITKILSIGLLIPTILLMSKIHIPNELFYSLMLGTLIAAFIFLSPAIIKGSVAVIKKQLL